MVRLVRERAGRAFFRRLLGLVALCLWLLAGLDWLWNAAYYASTFAQRSGLEPGGSAEELTAVTRLFARRAGELAGQVERDEGGHFAASRKFCLERGVHVYDGLVEELPFLDIPATRAKPLICSRVQSILGFTGIYFPFTGEANESFPFLSFPIRVYTLCERFLFAFSILGRRVIKYGVSLMIPLWDSISFSKSL